MCSFLIGLHELSGNQGRHVSSSFERFPDSRDKLIRGRMFQNVARGPRLKGADRIGNIGVHREKYNLDLSMRLFDLTNGLYAVEHRHRNVDNYHIGAEPFDGGDELSTVRDGTRDVEVGLKQPLQSFNNNFVVISDQYPRPGHALPLMV